MVGTWLRRFAGLMVAGLLSSCAPGPSVPSKPPLRIKLPDAWVEFNVKQRSTHVVPGSSGRILLTIEDITAGQVMMSLATDDGQALVETRSVSTGDSVKFDLPEQTYLLRVKELHSTLLADDVAVFVLSEASESSPSMTEAEKIEHLIAAVERLEDATFIRNGEHHTSAQAAGHMRDKWKWKTGEIKTARDFIGVVATRSSVSGEPYLIRFPDGRQIESAEYLSQELARIESGR